MAWEEVMVDMKQRVWYHIDRVSRVRLALLALMAITIMAAWMHSSRVFHVYLPDTTLYQVFGAIDSWQWILFIPVLTCFNLATRYFKWVFLLRTFGLMAPSRELLKSYLVSFSGNVVPFYLAYLARIVPLGGNVGRGLLVLMLDLLIDALAIMMVGYLMFCWALGIVFVLGLILVVLLSQAPRCKNGSHEWTVYSVGRIVLAVVFSIIIWWITGVALGCALKAFSADVDWLRAIHHFALSQQPGMGMCSLAGAGRMGGELIELLLKDGFPVIVAVGSTIVLRIWTFWLTIGVALVVLLSWRRMSAVGQEEDARFDAVASRYKEDMPEHMRRRYLRKKMAVNLRYLPSPRFAKGLDAGCGQGWYWNAMIEAGYNMTGVDCSGEQLKLAQGAADPASAGLLVRGSIIKLPFADQSFDFVYSINTLHHLASIDQQKAAFGEMHRVLKTGGRVIIHEMNIRNPLFRLYLSYVFPLIKAIDEGTEIWLRGDEQSLMQGFGVVAKEYQTLLPDITPRFLLPWLESVEMKFENNRLLRHWTAHVAYILEKEPSPLSGA